MDRVTRYPIFSIPDSPGMAGLALNGDACYTYQLVHVEASDSDWGPDQTAGWGGDRKAQPDVLRARAPRSLRTCLCQPSLRPEDEEEDEEVKAYRLHSGDARPRRPPDLEQERRAVIQGQAVRRSSTVATLHGAPDPGRPPLTPLEDSVVDREQINFLAARQQFLSLEQANAGAPQTPPARAAPERAPTRLSQAPQAPNPPLLVANGYGYAASAQPRVKEVGVGEKRLRGLPLGPGVQAMGDPSAWPPARSPEAPPETPIEREIRQAQEREEALREQRGLRRAGAPQELVQIPARPLLATLSPAAPRRDRGRPSLYVQRDLAQETQREEDHRRREGLQGGWAPKPEGKPGGPQPGLRRALSSDSILGQAPDPPRAADPPTPELRKVSRIPPDAYQPYLGLGAPQQQVPASPAPGRPGGLPAGEAKAAGPQRLPSEPSRKPPGTKQETWRPPGGPPPAHRGIVRWEYFRLRPLRFGVPEAPQKAEAPRTWGWEVAGAPALRLQRSQSSELLEREVESVLRREQEVAEERRQALFPEVFSPQPDGDGDGDPDSRSSSRASGTTGSYSVSESHFFTPIRLHSGLVWTAEAPAEAAPGQGKKKEQWYAGINPLDHVNSELLEATRVTRHKNAMAERWEAGVYASEDED
ncbi:mitotic interactor and substrate of PLK1 isoform X2 [Pipistrellus kuhlii]|uniref:mitotic interactor and substrate of PLK1 isoform X2 n=1 Tax=Pipistrellus kuhlii TaxID=59472 RepID=UPI00174F70BC|nr:mitotic interactor and substrate of PLK1 isoform X2 [Pipistrellus kuhlii]XP_036280972.1 mitotic interactor and substrate of PLK1 isoform X2 [Pipistrellus kuhlii]